MLQIMLALSLVITVIAFSKYLRINNISYAVPKWTSTSILTLSTYDMEQASINGSHIDYYIPTWVYTDVFHHNKATKFKKKNYKRQINKWID